jgi:anti-sigma factor ChrR (cupin superfamily)
MTSASSPSGTVWRKPLYRRGGEFGPVTSLVRYAPGCAFPEHTHPEGEEILVLEGEFGNEHGRYPEGTWIRSPHMSEHTPFSETGCLIYVLVGGL